MSAPSLKDLRELAVLGVVRAHPLHGYAIAEALEAGIGPSLGLRRPTVYAILKRFEAREWVDVQTERDSHLPERRVVTATPAGEAAHLRLLRRVVRQPGEAILPLAAVLAHLDDLPAGERSDVVAAWRRDRTAAVEHLRAFPEHPGSAGLAIELRIRQLELELELLARLD